MLDNDSTFANSPWRRHRDDIVERFEAAFGPGAEPAIDAYLPEAGPQRYGLLFELIHSDLELRRRQRCAVRLDAYLRRYPELECFPNELGVLLESEVRLRLRDG